MKYRVEHHRHPTFVETAEPMEPQKTEYTIDAATSQEAAILAQGYSEGYSGTEVSPIPFWRSANPTYPTRTISERIEDRMKYEGKRMDGGLAYTDNSFYGWIIVYPLDETKK